MPRFLNILFLTLLLLTFTSGIAHAEQIEMQNDEWVNVDAEFMHGPQDFFDTPVRFTFGERIMDMGIGNFLEDGFVRADRVYELVPFITRSARNARVYLDDNGELAIIDFKTSKKPKPREWIRSGPFTIDRSEYVLGEKIFVRIGGLEYEEKGQIVFLRPLNNTHYSVYLTIPFDGANKSAFNYYLEPQLSKNRELCTAEDFIGDWRVVFRGTDYPNLEFRITEEILPGEEDDYQISVC